MQLLRARERDSMRQPRQIQFPKAVQRVARSRPTNAAATTRGAVGPAQPESGSLHRNGAGRVHPDFDTPRHAGQIAAIIGSAALELAREANGAGLTTLGYLLEIAALEAGAEAGSSACADDTTEP